VLTIEVTFNDRFPLDMTGVLQDGFLGLCASVAAGSGRRTLLLHPTPHEYHVLKLQLKELETEGALTFVDRGHSAP
jgi:hypothetical protein